MCKVCGKDGCIGKYLLHSKELHEIPSLKAKELLKDPNTTFELVDSPSSGEVFNKFKELHVIRSSKEKTIKE